MYNYNFVCWLQKVKPNNQGDTMGHMTTLIQWMVQFRDSASESEAK